MEFRVRTRSFEDYARPVPFGRIGEEVPPAGMSDEQYAQSAEFREGQRFLRFSRPFRPDVRTEVVATDSDNGMWIPDHLLESADLAIAQ